MSEAAAGGWGELLANNGAGSSRAGSGSLPWEARPEPGALSWPGGGGVTHARHRTLAARVGMRMDFCSSRCLSVTLGTKDHDYNLHLLRLLPCPALPCQPWLVGVPNPHVFSLVNSRKTENSNYCFQRGCQRQSFSQSIVAAFLRGYCSQCTLALETFTREKLFCRSIQSNKS